MRQALINIATLVISGLIILTVIYLLVLFAENKDRVKRYTYTDNPAGIEISKHVKSNDINKYTVAGTMKNNTKTVWHKVRISIKIYAGKAYMNSCNQSYNYLPAHSSKDFSISCREIPGSNIPQNINYKIFITQGTIKNNV